MAPISLRYILLTAALGCAAAIALTGCHSSPPTPTSATSKPLTILQLIQQVNAEANPEHDEFQNAARVKLMQEAFAQHKIPAKDLMQTRITYAHELLAADKTDEALKEWAGIEAQVKSQGQDVWAKNGSQLLTQYAIAYLRMGEEQNCCVRNNANSCLAPIQGSGIHTVQEGSRGAIKCLTEALQLDKSNMAARWLINVAYMTVGDYPAKVPKDILIPPSRLGGEYPLPRFYNAAPEMGLDFLGWAGSVVLEDFEGNGLLDIMIASWNMTKHMQYFHNNGDGTFTDRTTEAGLNDVIGGLNVITTDYNNDGRPDVVVLRGGWRGKAGNFPLSLLRNDGSGHFTDVTLDTGLLSQGPTQTAVAFDYNGDGWLDLFVGYESTPGNPHPCKLFRNDAGKFTDVTQQCGINVSRLVKGVVSADYMHTGRPGVYLSCKDGPSILLRNDGPVGADHSPSAPWKFTDVSSTAGVSDQISSFSCFFFDYDNDGWPDLYVGGFNVRDVGEVAKDYLGLPTDGEKARLYHNNRDGTFTDVTKKAHLDKIILGMGINFGDLDNDGWLDFYVGTGTPDFSTIMPNRMFRNHDGKYFDEVTTTADVGDLQKGHGIAFGDINNNGQQDIFLVSGGALEADTAHDCLFINPGSSNHWVTMQLTGVKSNRIAIGAEICATVSTPSGERRIYKTAGPGGSFGNNPMRQEIGLGNATAITDVTIHWPASGIVQHITGLQMDKFYKITEGDDVPKPWDVPTFKLKHQN
jgi:hypothetical protein